MQLGSKQNDQTILKRRIVKKNAIFNITDGGVKFAVYFIKNSNKENIKNKVGSFYLLYTFCIRNCRTKIGFRDWLR